MSFEPQPANPFGWLILLLTAMMVFLLGFIPSSSSSVIPDPSARSQKPPVVTRGGEMAGILLPDGATLMLVERVDITVRESFPPQVTLRADGYWPDGCAFEPRTLVRRDGDTVHVRIYRIVPPDVMCTMVMTRADVEVAITDALMDGETFRSGTYTIDVNGVISTATF